MCILVSVMVRDRFRGVWLGLIWAGLVYLGCIGQLQWAGMGCGGGLYWVELESGVGCNGHGWGVMRDVTIRAVVWWVTVMVMAVVNGM